MEGSDAVDGTAGVPRFQPPVAPPSSTPLPTAGPLANGWQPLAVAPQLPRRSAWTTASLVVLGLALAGLVVGLVATVVLVAQPNRPGQEREAWAEFFAVLLTFFWVAGGVVLAFPLAAVGVVSSARRGGVRPVAVIALVVSGLPVAAGVGLWVVSAVS